jgi:hypothetical protein
MLGKLAPKVDPRTLRLANYVNRAALPQLPPSTNYRSAVTSWPMLANDRVGNCAEVGPLHQVQCWCANTGAGFTPTDKDALDAYSAITGYDPRNPATDRGSVMLDVLNFWRKSGLAGHKIAAYAKVALRDLRQAALSVFLFDGLLLGVNLPLAVQGAARWDVPANGRLAGRWTPGSWGGHCVPAVDYDAEGLFAVTWGGVLKMTWAFYAAYCDEAYCIFSPDWFDGANRAPNGFDWASLSADLAEITGQQGPPAPAPVNPPSPPRPTPPAPATTVPVPASVLADALRAGGYTVTPPAGG